MEMPAKILVVDDHEQHLTLLATILRRYGYDQVLTRNGDDTLSQVR